MAHTYDWAVVLWGLVSLLLVVCMTLVYNHVNIQELHVDHKHSSGSLHRSKRDSHSNACVTAFGESFMGSLVDKDYGKCKPQQPSHLDCLLLLEEKEAWQRSQKSGTLCGLAIDATRNHVVECSEHTAVQCWAFLRLPITRHSKCTIRYEMSVGQLEIAQCHANNGYQVLYNIIKNVFNSAAADHTHYYIFVSCNASHGKPRDRQNAHTRLIILKAQTTPNAERDRMDINVEHSTNKTSTFIHLGLNILFLSMMSRGQFYSQATLSADTLETLKSQDHQVFDFPLYQSTEMGNIEQYLKVLIGGDKESQLSEGVDEKLMPEKPLNTLADISFQHTMCSHQSEKVEGYLKELQFSEVFSVWPHDFHEKMNGAIENQTRVVNSTRISDFLCSVAADLTQRSVGKLSETCSRLFLMKWNLRYLDHLLQMTRQQPLLSFTTIHPSILEESQDTVQWFDTLMADHINTTLNVINQITVIVSDRGFLSRKTPQDTSYIRLEQENPLLLLLIPKHLKSYLGQEAMANLRINQRRLITIKDIHLTLRSLLNKVVSPKDTKGHLSSDHHVNWVYTRPRWMASVLSEEQVHGSVIDMELPWGRTCDSMAITQPNLCICMYQYVSFKNDSLQVAKAEFTLARLNEIIRSQVSSGRLHSNAFSHSPYGTCEKLWGTGFDTVNVRRMGDTIETTLNIKIRSGHHKHAIMTGKRPLFDQFRVVVQTVYDNASHSMRLTYYERQTDKYAYRSCQDEFVDDDLCICHPGMGRKYTFNKQDMLKQLSRRQFGVTPVLLNIHHTCLFLVIRNYFHSAVFEAANVCEDKKYQLTLNLYAVNTIFSSSSSRVHVALLPQQDTFLATAMQASYYKHNSQVWYTTEFSYINT